MRLNDEEFSKLARIGTCSAQTLAICDGIVNTERCLHFVPDNLPGRFLGNWFIHNSISIDLAINAIIPANYISKLESDIKFYGNQN